MEYDEIENLLAEKDLQWQNYYNNSIQIMIIQKDQEIAILQKDI